MRRNTFFYQALLLGAAALGGGCSSGEDWTADAPPAQNKVWTVSVQAMRDSITTSEGDMRSIAYGGNNGNRFSILWDTGDRVYVYKGSTYLGYLEPTADTYGNELGTLTGTLTGDLSAGQELKMYMQYMSDAEHEFMDFTGQDGTIAALSSRYSPQYATTTITAANIAGSTLTLKDFKLNHVSYYMRFLLTDATSGNRLHPSQFEIVSKTNKLARQMTVDGTPTPGSLVLNTAFTDGEYPGELWVSMYNFENAADTYTFRATVDGNLYVGPTEAFSANLNTRAGGMGTLRRAMVKTTAASTLTITAIPDQAFTGYAIEPALTVKDGDDVLTLGTDYSVAYTSNVNVGSATATITGLADAGDVVATKYLGTQPKVFNIVKATPVIEMSTATMEIVAGHSGQTRAVTRVFIDNNGNGTWDEGTDYDITALCSVTYASDNTGVATVNASTGAVSPAASPTEPTTATITATVAAATNWNSRSLSYTVNVETEVNTENEVNSWGNGGSDSDKIYVE